MRATKDNTIFVTAMTHRTRDYYVSMSTARKNDIFVEVLWNRNVSSNFLEIKTKPLYDHLRKAVAHGKNFVVFFDAYDIIFLAHRDAVIERLNQLYCGKVIFCADYPRSLYPYTDTDGTYDHDHLKSAWLVDWIQNGNTETSKLLNAGLFAGKIEDVLHLYDTVALVKSDFIKRKLTFPMASRLYQDLSDRKVVQDDQLGLWLTMLHYPELFHIDSEKKIFSAAATKYMTENNIDEYRKITFMRPLKDGTIIGQALVLHSNGGPYRNMGFVYRHDLHEPFIFKQQ